MISRKRMLEVGKQVVADCQKSTGRQTHLCPRCIRLYEPALMVGFYRFHHPLCPRNWICLDYPKIYYRRDAFGKGKSYIALPCNMSTICGFAPHDRPIRVFQCYRYYASHHRCLSNAIRLRLDQYEVPFNPWTLEQRTFLELFPDFPKFLTLLSLGFKDND